MGGASQRYANETQQGACTSVPSVEVTAEGPSRGAEGDDTEASERGSTRGPKQQVTYRL